MPLHRQIGLTQPMLAAVRDVFIEPSTIQHFEHLDAHADGDRPLGWGTLWATDSFDGEPAATGGACAAGSVLVQPAESDDRP